MAEPYSQTLGHDAAKIAEYVGIRLLGWQCDVVNDFLAVGDDGRWAHSRCCLSVPRQNGKSYLVIAICLYLMLVKNFKVAYTAQNYSTVLDIFDRFKRIFGVKPNDRYAPFPELNGMVSKVRGTASREGIELNRVEADGRAFEPCISFSTRTESSLRGQSYDALVVDEAQLCTGGQFASIGPVTKQGPAGNSIQIFLGTPETPTGRGEVFGNIRRDVFYESPERTCWIEWSVGEIGDVLDRQRWYATNPSLGILGDDNEMRSAAGTMNPLEFAQEFLGLWLGSASANAVIPRAAWDACITDSPPQSGADSLGVKFSPDGATVSVSACRRNGDDRFIELLFNESTARGTQWLADFVIKRKQKLACVAIDGQAGAQSLLDRLEGNVPRRLLARPKIQDVIAANAEFCEYASTGGISHAGGEMLTESATECGKRSIGKEGGFGWESTESCSASIVESAALATWASDRAQRKCAVKTGVAF